MIARPVPRFTTRPVAGGLVLPLVEPRLGGAQGGRGGETALSELARALSPRALDRRANAITDAMNAAAPWAWWPLEVPPRSEPFGLAAHGLYVVHALGLWAGARLGGARLPVPAFALVLLAGWVVFTAAWDRRALASG